MKRPPDPVLPPDHLSDRSRQLWVEIVRDRARSPGRLAMLRAALEALDRAEEARLAIATEGLTTTTKTTGAVHVHPLVKVERESRAQFLTAWGAMNLQWDASIDGSLREER